MQLESVFQDIPLYSGLELDPSIFYKYYHNTPETIGHNITKSLGESFMLKPLNEPLASNMELPFTFDAFKDFSSSDLTRFYSLLNGFNSSTPGHLPCQVKDFKTIQGTVTKNEVESPYATVVLHDKISGSVIKRTVADENGLFIFTDVPSSLSTYIVAFDYDGVMNTVVLGEVRT